MGGTVDLSLWGSLFEAATAHRDAAEDSARLAPEVLDAAAATGLWLLAAPSEAGGSELSLPDQLRFYEQLGAADPTVGWHALELDRNAARFGLVA